MDTKFEASVQCSYTAEVVEMAKIYELSPMVRTHIYVQNDSSTIADSVISYSILTIA